MTSRSISLAGTQPLLAAQAQQVAITAGRFNARILLMGSRGSVNGKSMLGLLSLDKIGGDTLTLIAEGPDEEQAADQIADLLRLAITLS